MQNGHALWTVAGALTSALTVGIAYQYGIAEALTFWFIATIFLFALRPPW